MTIDMSNNRVPYGLLTDEEAIALHEHEKAGGSFLYTLAGDCWVDIGRKATWNKSGIYRTVPLPKTQDVIAWDRLPDWVEWVARDIDGKVFMYDAPPDLRGDEWVSRFAVQGPINDFPGIVSLGTVDWRNSKQRRLRG
jgi:hypothetical protein